MKSSVKKFEIWSVIFYPKDLKP